MARTPLLTYRRSLAVILERPEQISLTKLSIEMEEKEFENQSENQNNLKINSPFVFISHDTRDAEIAEAFSKLLKSVSAGMLKSFRSSDNKGTQGIEFGIEWYPKIIENLQSSSDVICILTELSINRPWILFEAGMAKGKLNTPILGVAIGMPLSNANTGPFAQFQNCDDDISSLTKLIKQLVKKLPNAEPDEEVIKLQVETFKKTSTEIINKRQEASKNHNVERPIDNNEIAKLFEEIKLMFQELKSRTETFTSKTDDYEKIEEIERQMPDLEKLISIKAPQSSIRNLSKTMRKELLKIKDQTPDLKSKCNECLSKLNELLDKIDE